MTSATDTDIREIKDLIQGLDKKIEGLDKRMEVGFAKLEGKIDTVEAKLEGKLDAVAAKLEGKIDKLGELKNWKQIAIVIFTAIVGGAISWFVRMGKM